MDQIRQVNVTTELCGMLVLDRTTGERLGVVLDALVQPTTGRLLGITLRTPTDEARTVVAEEISIESGAVLARKGALSNRERLSRALAGGVYACKGIIGFSVVTEDGRLLGRVCEVYVSPERRPVTYRVAESVWRRLFDGDFFIRGDVPQSYSRFGARLIVPVDTVRRWATATPAEAIQTQ